MTSPRCHIWTLLNFNAAIPALLHSELNTVPTQSPVRSSRQGEFTQVPCELCVLPSASLRYTNDCSSGYSLQGTLTASHFVDRLLCSKLILVIGSATGCVHSVLYCGLQQSFKPVIPVLLNVSLPVHDKNNLTSVITLGTAARNNSPPVLPNYSSNLRAPQRGYLAFSVPPKSHRAAAGRCLPLTLCTQRSQLLRVPTLLVCQSLQQLSPRRLCQL
ncbi:hypothetical protein ABVT39_025116 [Epinephelus coioides]